MAITIDGTGTITGISAGGLPDDCIVTDDIAAGAVTDAKITGAITDAKLSGTTCKAWVNFNGENTVAIRASYNVSSITDRGTGDYGINFTTALADVNYTLVGTSGDKGSWGTLLHSNQQNLLSTTTVGILLSNNNGTGRVDDNYVNVAIFR